MDCGLFKTTGFHYVRLKSTDFSKASGKSSRSSKLMPADLEHFVGNWLGSFLLKRAQSVVIEVQVNLPQVVALVKAARGVQCSPISIQMIKLSFNSTSTPS